ncbi:hypothetical protein D3C87_2055570 [compost metagenome]
MDDQEENRRHPAEMQRIDLLPARMLDEAGKSGQQARDRQADDHAQDHPDMDEDFGPACLIHG